MLKKVGRELDESSLQTFTRAQQLSTNLPDLNHLIEGTPQCLNYFKINTLVGLNGLMEEKKHWYDNIIQIKAEIQQH